MSGQRGEGRGDSQRVFLVLSDDFFTTALFSHCSCPSVLGLLSSSSDRPKNGLQYTPSFIQIFSDPLHPILQHKLPKFSVLVAFNIWFSSLAPVVHTWCYWLEVS